MQKVNKEGGRVRRRGKRAARRSALARKGAEGRCGARIRADARAAVKRQGRRKGGEAVKGRAPRIVRARVVCNAPLYFAAASALFVKGVPVWLSQKAETPFLRRPCTAK